MRKFSSCQYDEKRTLVNVTTATARESHHYGFSPLRPLTAGGASVTV